MNKKIVVLTLAALLSFTSAARADFGFGFSFGDAFGFGRPSPRLHLGLATPYAPGEPSFGFGFDIPLVSHHVCPHYCEPLFDEEGLTYWEIYNNTDVPVKVVSRTGSKMIRPNRSVRLSHAASFKLHIIAPALREKVCLRSDSHYLTVHDDGGLLVESDSMA